ncbi:SDR family NAD(P)-dependent oxidoreductase [Ensifer soli]|uniref:SDR family NAD(P)-dependent oxidoreductase n=1 Tax=Ciceribacter sp. sgz301302 TaxID=3342379 RepID=UPI0035B85156
MTGTPLPKTPAAGLAGKRAIVTGAGRGIGVAAAAALAEAGAEVTLVARSPGEIEAVAAEIVRGGGRATPLCLDVTDPEAVRRAVAAEAPFDILVNNAGTNRPGPFIETRIADFDAVMGINARGAFIMAQAVAKRLVEAERPGSLIHVSSQMGHVGAANRTVYCMSKWAIEGLSKAMAVELAPYGIRSNTLCPTFIETPMTRPFLDNPDFRASVLSKIKLGRVGQPEDLMGAILFLAGDASALMTGASLVIDGGWTAE